MRLTNIYSMKQYRQKVNHNQLTAAAVFRVWGSVTNKALPPSAHAHTHAHHLSEHEMLQNIPFLLSLFGGGEVGKKAGQS